GRAEARPERVGLQVARPRSHCTSEQPIEIGLRDSRGRQLVVGCRARYRRKQPGELVVLDRQVDLVEVASQVLILDHGATAASAEPIAAFVDEPAATADGL